MAAVVEFPFARIRKSVREFDCAAEVVIFPGVRIERLEFDLAERIKPAQRGPLGPANFLEREQA